MSARRKNQKTVTTKARIPRRRRREVDRSREMEQASRPLPTTTQAVRKTTTATTTTLLLGAALAIATIEAADRTLLSADQEAAEAEGQCLPGLVATTFLLILTADLYHLVLTRATLIILDRRDFPTEEAGAAEDHHRLNITTKTNLEGLLPDLIETAVIEVALGLPVTRRTAVPRQGLRGLEAAVGLDLRKAMIGASAV
jgi:hypothetical protein